MKLFSSPAIRLGKAWTGLWTEGPSIGCWKFDAWRFAVGAWFARRRAGSGFGAAIFCLGPSGGGAAGTTGGGGAASTAGAPPLLRSGLAKEFRKSGAAGSTSCFTSRELWLRVSTSFRNGTLSQRERFPKFPLWHTWDILAHPRKTVSRWILRRGAERVPKFGFPTVASSRICPEISEIPPRWSRSTNEGREKTGAAGAKDFQIDPKSQEAASA